MYGSGLILNPIINIIMLKEITTRGTIKNTIITAIAAITKARKTINLHGPMKEGTIAEVRNRTMYGWRVTGQKPAGITQMHEDS